MQEKNSSGDREDWLQNGGREKGRQVMKTDAERERGKQVHVEKGLFKGKDGEDKIKKMCL